jgi:lipopolysaccharide export LptBFGC system permease protein LptF
VLRPMLLCGVIAGLAMAASWQWVVPHVGASIAADETFLKARSPVLKHLVHDSHGEVSRYVFVREFDPVAETVKGICMLVESTLAADAVLVTAEAGAWDPEREDWHLVKGLRVRRYEQEPQEWLERPDLTPTTLLQSSRDTIDPETLSYTDLVELAVARPNRTDVRLALHRHITHPLANVLLLLLALPLAVWYERGSRIEPLLAAIGLCGGYMLCDLTCQSLGQRGLLHPIVAAWSPTILFGSLGIVLFGSART